MAQSNYQAWQIDAGEFSDDWSDIEKLYFFARYAILAPSGHNTQPWRFSDDGQQLLLKADTDRVLPYSGIQANEPYVSLGTCLGTLELAARGFGYDVTIKQVLTDKAVASVGLSQKRETQPALLEAITQRRSNRSPYDTEPLPENTLRSIVDNPYKNVAVDVVTDKDEIRFVANQTTEATYRIFGDKDFRAELSKWVRNNLTRQYDGMPGFVQGIPTPPSLFAKHIISKIDVSKDQAKKDSGRVLSSANLVLVSVLDGTQSALLNAGSMYARICVLAQLQDIATSGVGTAIIEPEAREKVIQKFGLAGKPIAIIRLGKAKKAARHTPRWPLTEVSG